MFLLSMFLMLAVLLLGMRLRNEWLMVLAYFMPATVWASATAVGVVELDPTAAAQEVLNAVQGGQWWILAAIVVRFAVQFGRPLLAARVPFFASKPGALLLVFLASAIGGVLTALQAGVPLTSALILGTVVKVAAGAIAAHKVADVVAGPTPAEVAATAAAKATTPESAAEELRKLGQSIAAEELK